MNQAIEKFDTEVELAALENIKNDHIEAVKILQQHVADMDGTPAGGSGAWGTFAKAVKGGAKMLGESPALAALIAGTEHGISEYEDALEDESAIEEIKGPIRYEAATRPASSHRCVEAFAEPLKCPTQRGQGSSENRPFFFSR